MHVIVCKGLGKLGDPAINALGMLYNSHEEDE